MKRKKKNLWFKSDMVNNKKSRTAFIRPQSLQWSLPTNKSKNEDNNQLQTTLHTKPTNIYQFLHVMSCHWGIHKKSIPYS